LACIAALCAWPRRAWAAVQLAVGDAAPEFTAFSVSQGKRSTFDLRRAAARDGMLLLYFFPEAFSPD